MTSSASQRVLSALRHRGETVATAESLTGGLVGALITEVPGASQAYVGGVISYATWLKSELAGVDADLLDREGPVAAATAAQMAAGVASRCAADWGLGITGVAGPEPQDGHPVGQVFVAVARHADPVTTTVVELGLAGTRAEIRAAAAERALDLLAEQIGKAEPAGRRN